VGTNEQIMAWMMDTYSNHVGYIAPGGRHRQADRARRLQGRREATGAGVAYLVKKYLEDMKIPVGKATVAIQGFGNVGARRPLALASMGAKIIAISDYTGGDPQRRPGSTSRRRSPTSSTPASSRTSTAASPSPTTQLLELDCTVLVPAALERVITLDNAPRLSCRLLAEAANGPTTNAADRIIEERGDIELIPDVLCNSGGVIVSYFEWLQNLQSYYWTATR
jgi:glutamate dehydrogenase (NAD(P)+)